MSVWQPIDTAPHDGTMVDLWITGSDNMVDFYSTTAKKIRGKPIRHGRAPCFVWAHNPPNNPNWYPYGVTGSYPLSPDVTATHWMRIPGEPTE